MPESALAVHDVVKRFGGLIALDQINMNVSNATIHGIIGPNGAGKTTLLNLISGFDAPTSGSIEVFGDEAGGLTPHRVAALRVGRTYQNIRLFPGLSVLDTVVAGRHRHRRAGAVRSVLLSPLYRSDLQRARDDACCLLERVGLAVDVERRADELSYGDQRRLEIARALATEPRLLLLDEPTAGMNAIEAAALSDLLNDLRSSGLTQVLIEHNINVVTDVCDSATVLNHGSVIADGSPLDCLADAEVRRAYFGGI